MMWVEILDRDECSFPRITNSMAAIYAKCPNEPCSSQRTNDPHCQGEHSLNISLDYESMSPQDLWVSVTSACFVCYHCYCCTQVEGSILAL